MFLFYTLPGIRDLNSHCMRCVGKISLSHIQTHAGAKSRQVSLQSYQIILHPFSILSDQDFSMARDGFVLLVGSDVVISGADELGQDLLCLLPGSFVPKSDEGESLDFRRTRARQTYKNKAWLVSYSVRPYARGRFGFYSLHFLHVRKVQPPSTTHNTPRQYYWL